MNQFEIRKRFSDMMPEVPDTFDAAMRGTLARIVAEESVEDTARGAGVLRRGTRRTLALALLIALVVATVAAAAIHWHVFDSIFGKTPQNADMVMQGNLYQTTVNNVEITVKEAGYDGMTLYLLYSYRMLDVDTPLGMYRDGGEGGEGIGEEDYKLLHERKVGWWIDHIWFDGKCMDMPSGSGGSTSGSKTPGELVEFQSWRLDNENVFLDGPTQISLPIGDYSWKQQDDFVMAKHPERYDADGNLILPDKGIVTFTLDTSMRDKVVTETPNIVADLPDLTVKVSKVSYTPIMMYVTLEPQVKQEALDAFIAENGEGSFYGSDGTLLWKHSGMDVFGSWITGLYLVDGDGKQVFPDLWENNGFVYGNQGYGDNWAEYLFPYSDDYPDEMWLAPLKDDGATGDLALGVRVR